MNPQLQLRVRNAVCDLCSLSENAEEICTTGRGPIDADIVVVSKNPSGKAYSEVLKDALRTAGLDPERILFTSAVKCLDFTSDVRKTHVKACKPYLETELEVVQPKWILALGNEPLQAIIGKSGISKYRGRVFQRSDGSKVIPTISPAAAIRNPGQAQGFQADIGFFAAQVMGKGSGLNKPKMRFIQTKEDLKWLVKELQEANLISYDIETTAPSEFDDEAAIVSLAGTTVNGEGQVRVWAVPLFHPESPFRKQWQRVLRILAPHLTTIKRQVAHNGKFDARWLRHFGVRMSVTFDTLLAQHTIDENKPRGLKPMARVRLGVPPWGIDTKNLLTTPIKEVLEYNILDTFYTYHIYLQLREELIKQPRLLRLYKKLILPANEEYIDTERHGIWVDRERLATNGKIAQDELNAIEEKLMEWVPPVMDPSEYEELDWPHTAKGKPAEVNFNASNFARWFLFEHLELPVLARGKKKDDGSSGDPSMKEDVLLELRGQHPVVELMLERVKWQKYCSSFFSAYEEVIGDDDRIHTTFKLYGTVTGRTSSGKAEEEKITAHRGKLRGVNLQQVPRDPFVRGLFGAPPGWSFVQADYSQIELRVVALLSRDPTMLHLYQTGQDIHRATAASVLGIPPSQIDKVQRKSAKAVNFGFVYGMGAKKFVSTAFEKYDLRFSIEEAAEIRKAYFAQFTGLQPWHAKQRKLVRTYKRVQSPLGRVRHLPDIDSGDQGVRAEAERQAINSPVQSFASDITLLAMVIINQRFRDEGIKGHCVGTVHDACNFEIWDPHMPKALPIIKDTMENLPLRQKFGIHIDIPIIADLAVGSHWGDARELEPAEVYNYKVA